MRPWVLPVQPNTAGLHRLDVEPRPRTDVRGRGVSRPWGACADKRRCVIHVERFESQFNCDVQLQRWVLLVLECCADVHTDGSVLSGNLVECSTNVQSGNLPVARNASAWQCADDNSSHNPFPSHQVGGVHVPIGVLRLVRSFSIRVLRYPCDVNHTHMQSACAWRRVGRMEAWKLHGTRQRDAVGVRNGSVPTAVSSNKWHAHRYGRHGNGAQLASTVLVRPRLRDFGRERDQHNMQPNRHFARGDMERQCADV